MNCETCREWIEEAALGSLDDPRRAQLDTHLAKCERCRDAFAAERSLLAAIDRGIAAGVEGTPSADFAARVRMRLAEERQRPESRSWWRSTIWIPVLGSAALALLLLAVWIARRPAEHRPPQQAAKTVGPTAPPGHKTPEQASVTRPFAPRRLSSESVRTGQIHRKRAGADSQSPPLQVQIQPGQWAAVTSLYRAGQAGRLNGAATESTASDQPLQVKPVDVAPLVVAELQDPKPVGSEPESTNVQDR